MSEESSSHKTNSPTRESEHTPAEVAKKLGMGFIHHDQRNRELSVNSFSAVDRFQFGHLTEDSATHASEAYVDALWKKDIIEDQCTHNGKLHISELKNADWSPVREAFEQRASIVGMNSEYADLSTTAWLRHKVGGDYWTPMKQAQVYELQAALRDPEYPHKLRGGQSGHGPEAARYALGVELHDTRRFDAMVDVMVPYFERIADRHQTYNEEAWNDNKTVPVN